MLLHHSHNQPFWPERSLHQWRPLDSSGWRYQSKGLNQAVDGGLVDWSVVLSSAVVEFSWFPAAAVYSCYIMNLFQVVHQQYSENSVWLSPLFRWFIGLWWDVGDLNFAPTVANRCRNFPGSTKKNWQNLLLHRHKPGRSCVSVYCCVGRSLKSTLHCPLWSTSVTSGIFQVDKVTQNLLAFTKNLIHLFTKTSQ